MATSLNYVSSVLLLAALAASWVGCNAETDGSSSTTGGGSSSGSTSTGDPSTPMYRALARFNGGDAVVTLSSYDRTCSVDTAPLCPSQSWEVTLEMPVTQLKAGSSTTFEAAKGKRSFQLPTNDASGECIGGPGDYTAGTLEVLDVTDSTAAIKLSGTNPPFGDGGTTAPGSIDGTYEVHFCDPLPAPEG